MSITFLIAATMMAAPTTAETDAMFAAAGGVRRGKAWTMCREDARATMRIDLHRDLNGDGRKDVIVVEDSARCYGAAGTSFVLIANQPGGKWKKMLGSVGVAEVLDQRRGVGNWPDISVGGPGFCFPVLRWNGREYVNHRREYNGKPCR
jgi:hypothetical protein